MTKQQNKGERQKEQCCQTHQYIGFLPDLHHIHRLRQKTDAGRRHARIKPHIT